MSADWPDPLTVAPQRLLSMDELAEVCRGFAPLLAGPLAICLASAPTVVVAGDSAAMASPSQQVLVLCVGEPALVIHWRSAEPRDVAIITAMQTALEIAAHQSFGREVAMQTHEAAMDVNFDEVTQANQQLARSVTRLGEVDRLKAHIMANMSHELRTPLTAIIGFTEMMVDGFAGPITPEQKEYLATILAKSEQLLGLITTVLDVATLDSDRREPARLVSLTEVVRSELATLTPTIQHRRLQIQVRAYTDESVVGSPRQLRQIVNCLLSNAIKFSPDAGVVEVVVRVEAALLAHGALVLEVVDSGVGIPADKLVHIFEPFYQVDPSSTRAFGGTGIGLTLVKAYVEAHHGTVAVTSTAGQGSSFRVILPLPRVER
ncbi:MAG: HAMP domain-containing histidine kinase [Kofleriaceae bacterium]|nr:HAMP domain-containing histidine kinase [Kofleriaceae bacterium]